MASCSFHPLVSVDHRCRCHDNRSIYNDNVQGLLIYCSQLIAKVASPITFLANYILPIEINYLSTMTGTIWLNSG